MKPTSIDQFRPRVRFRPWLITLLGIIAIASSAGFASAQTWIVTTSDTWTDPGAWSGGVPTSGGTAILNNSGTILLPATVAGSYSNFQVGTTSGSTGTVLISGGTLAGSDAWLGYAGNASGTAIVTSGSWYNSDALYVGESGTGSLSLSGNGVIQDTTGYIGDMEGSSGTVTVTGGTWSNTGLFSSGALYVGESGTGTLSLSGSGVIIDVTGYIGDGPDASGAANVTGGTWTNTSALTVGQIGTGSLSLSGSGVIAAGYSYIGGNPGSNGTATVTGGTWNTENDTDVGYSGTGSLSLSGSGALTDTNGEIAALGGSSGTVTMTGGTWNDSVLFEVGFSGTGSLLLSGSGAISDSSGDIGYNSGASGTAVVTGGTWTSNSFTIGNSGTGFLVISGSGVVSVGTANTGTVQLGQSGGVGTLQFGNGTTTAGTLRAGIVYGGNSTANVIFDETGAFTFAPNLVGSMTVAQEGPGTTMLTGTNSFTGNTRITAGKLLVTGSSISTSGTVSISGGAALGTSGAATGGAKLSNVAVGTLLLTSGGTPATSSVLMFDLAASGSSDSITATTLDLTDTGTILLQLTDVSGGSGLSGIYTLLTWSNTSVGTLGDFAIAAGFTGNGSLELNETGGNSELQFVASAVPEPSALLMVLVGTIGVLLWRTLRGKQGGHSS